MVSSGSHQGDGLIKNGQDQSEGHAFQSCQPGSAQEMHQDCFHLVIGSVTNRNCLGTLGAGILEEKLIA